jgi:nucleotide-binding universal stress UspA family protein
MKVLFAYDGADCSKAALHDLVNAGIPSGSTIYVISVCEAGDMVASNLANMVGMAEIGMGGEALAVVSETMVQQAHEFASSAASEIERLLPDVNVSFGTPEGSAAHEILEIAHRDDIDLIVMGSHGRGLFARALLGSVALHVLHNVKCSVRIVKTNAACADAVSGGRQRLLLAVDGSHDSNVMLDIFATRRWRQMPDVTLVNVDDLAIVAAIHGISIEFINEETANQSKSVLKEAKDHLLRYGILASTLSLVGSPVGEIVKEAHALGTTAIYVGAQGHGTIERMLLGSVSHGVVLRSDTVVEVIR